VLHGQALPATVIVPLRGRVQVADGEQSRVLGTGEMLVAESGQRLQIVGRGTALWVAVFAPARVWHHLAGEVPESAPDPLLVPSLHAADRGLRRAIVRLARVALESRPRDPFLAFAAASAFASLIVDLQSEFAPLIARCPGRTLAQRRSVFLRLQRVRNYMASSCHLDLDIAGFARMASYSPCHFIRAFSTVYGETPHAVLVEHRLGRAHRLINESELAITEVARASGFENRCAFSRSFKRRFGITAADLREFARGAERAAA
jgi:AraC family transcriptional regulator